MIETERRNHVATRNQELAALRTFYRYIAVRHPEMLAEAERVEAIPSKRCPAPKTILLEREETDALFKALPKDGTHTLRDRALLMILYNTGLASGSRRLGCNSPSRNGSLGNKSPGVYHGLPRLSTVDQTSTSRPAIQPPRIRNSGPILEVVTQIANSRQLDPLLSTVVGYPEG